LIWPEIAPRCPGVAVAFAGCNHRMTSMMGALPHGTAIHDPPSQAGNAGFIFAEDACKSDTMSLGQQDYGIDLSEVDSTEGSSCDGSVTPQKQRTAAKINIDELHTKLGSAQELQNALEIVKACSGEVPVLVGCLPGEPQHVPWRMPSPMQLPRSQRLPGWHEQQGKAAVGMSSPPPPLDRDRLWQGGGGHRAATRSEAEEVCKVPEASMRTEGYSDLHTKPSAQLARKEGCHPKVSSTAATAQPTMTTSIACLSTTPARLSIGSVGHPHTCAEACKYFWKNKGCKDGVHCIRCHLCRWTIKQKKTRVRAR